MTRGFVLVELIVALVVLITGILGIAGVALHASQILTRAAELEYAVAIAEGVADSLMTVGGSTHDSARTAIGAIVWSVRADGSVRVTVGDSAGPRVDFRTRVPAHVR